LGTHFEVVRTDTELRQLQKRYLHKGEKVFVRLEEELGRADVYGITIKLKQRELWEPDFVSVIDCRGDKACKAETQFARNPPTEFLRLLAISC
jgi:hypothetical protein